MPRPLLELIAEAAGLDLETERVRDEIAALLSRAEVDARSIIVDLLKARRERDSARHYCTAAAEAATKLEEMLAKIKRGSARLTRLLAVRDTDQGPVAVCAANGYCQEIPIHPDVNIDELKQLKSWEYVAIHDDVVVNMYKGDPALFARALGEVVAFRGYLDRDRDLIRVSHGPQEKTVQLDPSVNAVDLTPNASLVIQSDMPERAIAVVPAEFEQSRFEVPIDTLTTRLEDLAGVEKIADDLLRDILLHTRHESIRNRFRLQPLKGLLLYSPPGMGKTALVRALALFLHQNRDKLDADIILYSVKPNETKSMWHGEDARIVREDLFGAIRARQKRPRTRRLIQVVVFDEIDNFGKRAGSGQHVYSAAQSESLEALLVELDGLVPNVSNDAGPPAHLLCIGLTNRVDRVDEAVKRPGRFDRVIPMPPINQQQAEDVMMIYAQGEDLPWFHDETIRTHLAPETLRKHYVRPAVAWIYSTVIVRYKIESQRLVDVTAGDVLTSVHYMDAMNRAKREAAMRALTQEGVPAVTVDDVIDSTVQSALDVARQMETDPEMLIRRLDLKIPITDVQAVPAGELEAHRHLRVHSA